MAIPDRLTPAAISASVAAVRDTVRQCGDAHAGTGSVKLLVTVEPSGAVRAVSVIEAPTPGLGECAAAAVRAAVFPVTQLGGKFSYPFVF